MNTRFGFLALSLALGLGGCLTPVGPFQLFQPEIEEGCLQFQESVDVSFPQPQFPRPSATDPTAPQERVGLRATTVEAHVEGCSDALTYWDLLTVDMDIPEGTTASLEVRRSASEPWSFVADFTWSETLDVSGVALGFDSAAGLDLRIGILSTSGGQAPEIRGAVIKRTCSDSMPEGEYEEEWEDWYDEGGCG